jgi:hypothetical protein
MPQKRPEKNYKRTATFKSGERLLSTSVVGIDHDRSQKVMTSGRPDLIPEV